MIATPLTPDDPRIYAPPPGMQGLYSLAAARLWLGGISRPTIYRLMERDQLEWRQVGAGRAIPWWALLDYQRRVDAGEMAGTYRLIRAKKEAPTLASKRTQTRKLGSQKQSTKQSRAVTL